MKTISPSLRGVAGAFAITVFFLFSSCGTETSKSSDAIAEQAGTTVNVRVEGAVTNLNMYLSKTAYSLNVAMRIFQSLGDLDPKTQELVPLMVKALPLKRDVTEGPYKGMLAFDFEILDEAVWDNGSPVTGKDVEFSFKILFHPNLPTESWRSYFGYMVGMDVDPANPKKFTAYFNQYYMLMVEGLCGIPIYPAYNYDPNNHLTNVPLADFLDPDKAGQLKDNPAVKAFAEEFLSPKFANDKNYVSGSGPYRLESTDGD
jgi:peptide/nickel transport system substrate-binding protein